MTNKILIIIFGLLLLNLAREYTFVKSPNVEYLLGFSAAADPPLADNIIRKDWSYYSSIFNKKDQPIKIINASIPIVLRGTVISNPNRSFAIIEDMKSGTQDLYRLGDVVNGAKIVAMNRNRVVLDYNGTKQELNMFEAEPDPCFARVPRCSETRHVRGSASNMGEKGVDFTKMLTELRIKPYFSGGRCVGFQLNNINSSFIKQMGLRDGDIVESINGVRVDDPLKALQILYSIERNNPVHLGIERSDEKMELDCKVEG